MGRPTKLTPEVQQRIVQAIGLGATYELAAQYGGVSYDTFNEWMKKAAGGANGIYRQLSEAVQKAEGVAVVGWLAKIEKAASDGEWTAAAWKLERRYPHDYGRRAVEVSGKDGGPIRTENLSALTVADLLSLVEAARAGTPAAIPEALTDAAQP